jgi:PhnB protein
MKLNPYLHFAGEAQEAMEFYQKVFNANVALLNRYGEAPFPSPEEYKDAILHARLEFGENILMLSDVMPGRKPEKGDHVTLAPGFETEDETRAVFEQLAAGGTIDMPLEHQFWGALYGQVTDKFNVEWMLNSNS